MGVIVNGSGSICGSDSGSSIFSGINSVSAVSGSGIFNSYGSGCGIGSN